MLDLAMSTSQLVLFLYRRLDRDRFFPRGKPPANRTPRLKPMSPHWRWQVRVGILAVTGQDEFRLLADARQVSLTIGGNVRLNARGTKPVRIMDSAHIDTWDTAFVQRLCCL